MSLFEDAVPTRENTHKSLSRSQGDRERGEGSLNRRLVLGGPSTSIAEPVVDLSARQSRGVHQLLLLVVVGIRIVVVLDEPRVQHLGRCLGELQSFPLLARVDLDQFVHDPLWCSRNEGR